MSFKFDHRLLADEMEIFFLNEHIGAGLPMWLPNGVAIREALEKFIKDLENQAGYQRVASPHIGKSELYQCSGHLTAFHENMFPPINWPEDNSQYYLKPMNCPHHHKIFANSLRSYRQLPLRIAEYGQVYRYENSGSLKGLSRVRGLCQNDAHIYIEEAQVKQEIRNILDMHEFCYHKLGLKGYRYRLSKHDPENKEAFDGQGELWLKSEAILRECIQEKKLPCYEAKGEAAFYGPKLDVQMKMGDGHEESIASIQIDFNSAERFGLQFISSLGKNERPWIIHRAPLGSHERFVAMLLEYYDGQLPGWLSPIQVYIIPLGEEERKVSEELAANFRRHGIRASLDKNEGSLSKRILFAHKLRPFSKLVIGAQELASGEACLEFRNSKIKALFSDLPRRILDEVNREQEV